MSGSQELAVREKQEVAQAEEKTTPGRYYVPAADIFETDEALTLMLEMPGVSKNNIDVQIENDVLRVEGKIDYAAYRDVEPVYTEYILVIMGVDLRCRVKSIVQPSVRSWKTVCSH